MNEIPAAVAELIEWRRKEQATEQAEALERDRVRADEKFARFEAHRNTVWEALKPYAVRKFDRIKVNAPGLYPFEIQLGDDRAVWLCQERGVAVTYPPNDRNEYELVREMAEFLTELKALADTVPEPKPVPPFEQYHLFDAMTPNEIQEWLNKERSNGYFLRSVKPYGEGELSRYFAVTESQI